MTPVFDNFYRGKRFLITGVAGVKGTWLALALLEAGSDVVGLDLHRPEPDSNFQASGLAQRITFVQGDAADVALVRELLAGTGGVFHMAAVSLVGEARRDPFETYRSNTLGAAAVLEALRLHGRAVRAVFVTTDKVYRPKGDQPWMETDPLGASGPYAISKSCAEFIIADYQRTYFADSGVRIGIARAGNVIIGGDLHSSTKTHGAGRLVPDCYEALANNRAPEVFCPAFTRPYMYGLDVIAGYMALMSKLDERGVRGEAFNFGPLEKSGVSNAELATRICELWGGGLMWRSGAPREEPFESQSLSWDKSRRTLGWAPAFTLDQTLAAAARWYKEWARRKHPREGDMYDLNRELLAEHRNAARALGIAWAGAPQPQMTTAAAHIRDADA